MSRWVDEQKTKRARQTAGSCHSERSRGICLRTRGAPWPQVDVSTSRCSARHDRREALAFTLIELLVVIAVVALLMAILLPTLSRVRKQARAVACQSNLRQWGLALQTYAVGNDGKVPPVVGMVSAASIGGHGQPLPLVLWSIMDSNDVWLCPMARRPPQEGWHGGTFRAWIGPIIRRGERSWSAIGSYGQNLSVGVRDCDPHHWQTFVEWQTIHIPGAAHIPFFFDCVACAFLPTYHEEGIGPPPQQEGRPDPSPLNNHTWTVCINRHDGGINMALLDASVRKVGLKELWSLRWEPCTNTANRWTKAGGVRPQDWPKWMRKFKDY
jgi:prepilin-type N-terminal cleavage/methylation domain-containing protein/prepilin-type processing-associated H-X9-DG protein